MATTLIVIGIVLLIGAFFAANKVIKAKRDLGALSASSPMSAQELAAMHAYGPPPGSEGQHSSACQITGAAQPGPAGLLKSKLTNTDCVWFRYKITRHYIDIDRDSDGSTDRNKRSETWDEGESSEVIQLVDAHGGTVLVDPRGGRPDGVHRVLNRKETKEQPDAFSQMFSGDIKGGLKEIFRSDDGRTTAMEYEEWVLKPGTPLFVLGEARNGAGALTVGKPAGKHSFIISTKSAEEIKAQKASHQKWALIAAPLAGVAGLAALIVGIIMKVG